MMDTARLALVYMHLIACCIAVGAILSSDAKIVARLLSGRVPEIDGDLHKLHALIGSALAVLWATGAALVWLDSLSSSLGHVLSNPKMQAKIIVVSLLTVNGLWLNARVLPLLSARGSLLHLTPWQRTGALLAGALSGVSWMYAVFFGIGRTLSWKYPLAALLGLYPVFVLAGFAGMWMLTAWARLHPRMVTWSGLARRFMHETREVFRADCEPRLLPAARAVRPQPAQ